MVKIMPRGRYDLKTIALCINMIADRFYLTRHGKAPHLLLVRIERGGFIDLVDSQWMGIYISAIRILKEFIGGYMVFMRMGIHRCFYRLAM